MIITSSNKPIRIIGFAESTITQEGVHFLSTEFNGEITVITPDDFLTSTNKHDFQYLIFFTLETTKRIEIIEVVESLNLECVTFIHNSVVMYKDFSKLTIKEIQEVVGHGTVISAFSTILLHAKIGKHCIIEPYGLVAHYSELKDNVIMHFGTWIAGRTTVGSNCVFNVKSSAINNITICDNVEVGALSNITKNVTMPGRYLGTVARYTGAITKFEG